MEVSQDMLNHPFCSNCKNEQSFNPVLICPEGKIICGRCQLSEELTSKFVQGCEVQFDSDIIPEHEAPVVCLISTDVLHNSWTASANGPGNWTKCIPTSSKNIRNLLYNTHWRFYLISVRHVWRLCYSIISVLYFFYCKNSIWRKIRCGIICCFWDHNQSLYCRILKKKPVQAYSRFTLNKDDSIHLIIHNFVEELSKYKNADFNLRYVFNFVTYVALVLKFVLNFIFLVTKNAFT